MKETSVKNAAQKYNFIHIPITKCYEVFHRGSSGIIKRLQTWGSSIK